MSSLLLFKIQSGNCSKVKTNCSWKLGGIKPPCVMTCTTTYCSLTVAISSSAEWSISSMVCRYSTTGLPVLLAIIEALRSRSLSLLMTQLSRVTCSLVNQRMVGKCLFRMICQELLTMQTIVFTCTVGGNIIASLLPCIQTIRTVNIT